MDIEMSNAAIQFGNTSFFSWKKKRAKVHTGEKKTEYAFSFSTHNWLLHPHGQRKATNAWIVCRDTSGLHLEN